MVQAVAVVASLRPAGLVSMVRAMMGDRDRPGSLGVAVEAAALVRPVRTLRMGQQVVPVVMAFRLWALLLEAEVVALVPVRLVLAGQAAAEMERAVVV